MATKLSAGKASRTGDSLPKYRGPKKYDGEKAKNGDIIIRQTGSDVLAGAGTRMGRDFTVYSVAEGKVKFSRTRKVGFNGKVQKKKVVSVV